MRSKFIDVYIKHYCSKKANAVPTPYTYDYTTDALPVATWGDAATTLGIDAAIPTGMALAGGTTDALKGTNSFFRSTGTRLLDNFGLGFLNRGAATAAAPATGSPISISVPASTPVSAPVTAPAAAPTAAPGSPATAPSTGAPAPNAPSPSRFTRFAKTALIPQIALGSVMGLGSAGYHTYKTGKLDGQDFINHMNDMGNNWELLDSWKRIGQSRNAPEYLMHTLGAVFSAPLEIGQLGATFNQRLQARNISKSLANHEVDGFVDNSRLGDLFFGLFGNKKKTSGYRDFAQQAKANGLKGSEHYYNTLIKAHDEGRQLNSNDLSHLEDYKFYNDAVARNKMYPAMTFDKYRQYRALKKSTGSGLTQQEFLSGTISADTHNKDQKNMLDQEYAKLDAQKAQETT